MKIINDNQIVRIQRKLAQIQAAAHNANTYLGIISKSMPEADKASIAGHIKCLSDAETNSNQIGKELESLKRPDSN